MLIFGHLGITFGIIKTFEKLDEMIGKYKNESKIDYRMVFLGGLLPDIIDKPLVVLLANTTVGSAKSIAHSLAFILFMLILSLFAIFNRKNNNILVITVCSFIHQILDGMWRFPREFLWPFYGVKNFDNGQSVQAIAAVSVDKIENVHTYIKGIDLNRLLSIPYFYVSEIIGGIIIIAFISYLAVNGQIRNFICTGNISKEVHTRARNYTK